MLPAIRADFALGTAQAGLLTTLLARACGIERSLFAAIVLVGGGVAVRSLGPLWCLYVGTLVLGTGIAIANVLLPSLPRRQLNFCPYIYVDKQIKCPYNK